MPYSNHHQQHHKTSNNSSSTPGFNSLQRLQIYKGSSLSDGKLQQASKYLLADDNKNDFSPSEKSNDNSLKPFFMVGRTAISIIKMPEDDEATANQRTVRQKLVSLYGLFRFIQIFLSFIELGLVFALIAVDKEYRLYTFWLVHVPLLSIVTVLIQLFSPKCRINNACLDMIQASLYFSQGLVVVLFYMYLYAVTYWGDLRGEFFFPVSTSAAAFCFVNSLVFWLTGCSSACCRCLHHKDHRLTIAV